MAEIKEKKYVSDNAQLMSEWDWEKNNLLGFYPDKLTFGSNKKVWWICKKQHSWDEKIANRIRNRGCPYCSGHRVWEGFNDLATTHPQLCIEWDYSKNDGISPQMVSAGSSHNIWWKCSQGHTFQAKVSNRTSLNRGCPYCSGRYSIVGINDLETVNPALASEWHPTKNNSLLPSQVLPSSNKKVWWLGKCGHEWPAVIGSRYRGSGCPYCSHQKLDPSNSLALTNPSLSKEWHPTKNGTVTPLDVHPNSNLAVWWVCKKGHEWQASINNRNQGRKCPACSREYKTSFPEQALFYYIFKLFPCTINRYCDKGNELDIYIPSYRIGIEYDGLLYHTQKTSDKERKKDAYFEKQGVTIIRVKECKEDTTDSQNIIWHIPRSDYPNLNDVIIRTIRKLCETTERDIPTLDIDIIRDAPLIMSQYYSNVKDNGLSSKYPDIIVEWDYEKNGLLNPDFVPCSSSKKVWWKCPNGHSYQMMPAKRTSRNQGCPFCSGRYPTPDNNLFVKYPQICEEWSSERNSGRLPTEYTPHSTQKVWWICRTCGHEWEAMIANRAKGTGCPICARKNRK